jgi:large conductance mechanosensitive channel
MEGFKAFVLRGNVVDLAVGVVIGAAFGTVVTAFVEGLLTPIIGALGGVPDFSALSFTINESQFLYGTVINALIAFLMIAAAVYYFVVLPVNALMERRKTETDPLTETKDCPYCISAIPVTASRCPFCTSEQAATGTVA